MTNRSVLCPFCKRVTYVRADEMVRRHRDQKGAPCPGSQHKPHSVTAYWTRDGMRGVCMRCGDASLIEDSLAYFSEHAHADFPEVA